MHGGRLNWRVLQAALAGGAAWQEYGKLFAESRFVHVTSTDFAALSLFAPFWMWNDAGKRGWAGRRGAPWLLVQQCMWRDNSILLHG